MTTAVLGGGPAGAFTAERLARAGIKTLLFDEHLAWEKPCGGGLTAKAYGRYPFLLENSKPKLSATHLRFGTPNGKDLRIRLRQPMLIYAREELNGMLLERASCAGASVEKARVLAAERLNGGWKLSTSRGSQTADYCIVATGARNPLRQLGTRFAPSDIMVALGYYTENLSTDMQVEFLPNMEGYIWVFPRMGHSSVGICTKGQPSRVMRQELERYMDRMGISKKGATFFAHPIPGLTPEAWKDNRIAGDRWLAVGDAAGFVDPITGEGLYYALRSAELASDAVVHDGGGPEKWAQSYRSALEQDFIGDLQLGSRIAKRFYFGRFLGGSVTTRMVQFSRRSRKFADLMQDLLAGTQGYLGLKDRLYENLKGTLMEIFWSYISRRELRG
jgi:geranylgeranyl reductase family protein